MGLIRGTIITLILALASAGAATAAPIQDEQALRSAVYAASSSRAGPTAQTRARLAEGGQSGIARTTIDRKLDDNGLTGSLGFMCGNARTYNHSSPLGNDPAGRFIGAKLGLSF
jgi:hypothetical protein